MENDRNRRLVLGILLVAIVVATVGTTLAYFITQGGTNEEQKLTIKTGNLALTFEDNDSGLNASLSLGQTVSKEFKIINTGTEDVTTTVLWSGLVNTYLEESLQYRLQYKTSETGDWQDANIAHGTIPHSETAKDYNLSKDITIPSGETYFYKLDITFLNLANINQENDKTAKLTTKFNLGEKIVEGKNILAVRGTSYSGDRNYNEMLWAHADSITSVVFENSISPKENATYTYDMSDYGSEGKVVTYIVQNSDTITNSDNSTSPAYTAYIQADGNITANKNSSYLFYKFKNLKSIIGLEKFDTSLTINMDHMFMYCESLANLDITPFDTHKVINMRGMFWNCVTLSNLDISSFNTSNVTNMEAMFDNCSSLTNLDVSHFDTSKVTTMSSMFKGLKLTSLDLSNLDTSNVTTMSQMFLQSSNLKSLDLSNFNTSKVTNMQLMFDGCTSLTSLDISTWDTSNVTTMGNSNNQNGGMFQNCTSLVNLNLGNMNTSKVTSKSKMFYAIPANIKITVATETLRNWIIETSDSPKLTTSNFIVG